MEEHIIRLECLRLAQTGSPEVTIRAAQVYFDWIVNRQDQGRLEMPPKIPLSSKNKID